ncbi:hypothetical protein FJT64_003136 [Amphibalanus amphitrite]|nr:hypothetical protein FJT64_003136 [Amphibalanus amphitrite]
MKLDLRARRLLLEEKGVELELLSASQPQDTTSAQRVDLKLRRDVTVPPATEALVPVKRGGLRPGGEYLLESVGGGELPVVHVQDVFSRYLMLMPAEDNTAETAARLVYDRWICTFDVPLVITSDRGPHFAAETFRAMCRRTGVRHRMAQPDEVPRLESDASSGHSEPAPDGTESDVDDGDVDDGDGCLRDATSEDPESAYRRDPDGSDSRPRRQCGPPARLVIDPSRKRYEET